MRKGFFILITLLCSSHLAYGQAYAPGDSWYNNPLGFDPINLHTKNGFILPALVVGICLIATSADTTLINRVTVYNESGLSWGYKYPNTTLFQDNIGIQFFLRRWMSIGIDMGIYFPWDEFNSTPGVSLRPFARFYPVNNERWRLYFESGGGFIYFFDQFPLPTDRDPRLGTQWNGTTRYGIGTEINLSRNTSIMFGIRHVHVSNGNTSGDERNPSHDSNGFFVGASWRL